MKKIIDKDTILALILFAGGLVCYIVNGQITPGIFVAILLFIAGLVLLIKGGDWFVDGASAIAEKFHVPEILIGATVVSIGTTLPEVMVSSSAALKGNSGISYGNAIGSIICNVALIAAITITCKPAKVDKKPLRIPVIVFFIAAAYYCFSAYVTGYFDRLNGIVLLCIFVVYMVIVVMQAVKGNKKGVVQTAEIADAQEGETQPMGLAKALILLVFGAAVIAFGATLLVDNGTIIAASLGVPDSVIALTFVALGTSLPELVTAITSLAKGKGALSLGNIIGANIFNIVLVSGMAITLNPFQVPAEKMIGGINSSLIIDIPLMLFVMAFMTLPALIKGKLYRWQGIILLLLYAGFCTLQFVL